MAYRKLKDLENEIDFLTEGIERYRATEEDVQILVKLKEPKKKATAKLQKERNI